MSQSIVFTIQKAVLLATGTQANNYAVYQCDAPPALQIGSTVVVGGCTTGTFNGTLTVASVGSFSVKNDTGIETWSGFSVTMNHAAIAAEVEPHPACDGGEGDVVGTATGTVTQ